MPALARTKVGEKGRVVIPADMREALGIKTGDPIFIELVDDQITISTFASRLKRTQALMQKYGKPDESWADELIAERRAEAKREEEEEQEWIETRARG